MYFEVADTEAYAAARELLMRRCEAWARARDLPLLPMLANAMLDSRHFSTDGRLSYWTPDQVRRALLEWLPERVTAPEEVLLQAPGTLRTLLGYLQAHGLRDPRGGAAEDNDAAIDAAARELAAAVDDPGRYGPAKFIAMSALRHGIDVSNPTALNAFMRDIQVGRIALDEEAFQRAVMRQAGQPAPGEDRTFAQLPVRLPPAGELRDAAEASLVVTQLRAFTKWIGPQGRPLTAAGNLRPADARELVTLLGTGEEHLRFRSAAELPGLDLVVNWAKKARLVRKQGGRMVQVTKARPVLSDAEALWQRAFDSVFDLGAAVCLPVWQDEPATPVQQLYDLVLPDLLATIYSMEHPIPVARLAESVWDLVLEHFDVASLTPAGQAGARTRMENDLDHIFDTLEKLGALTSTQAVADEIFSADLAGQQDAETGAERPFPGERATALRARLARPGRLVALTPLGTRAMRPRLLAEGREAGLIGELVDASPAELLGTIAAHYTPASAVAEIAIWRAAHGNSLEPFLQAVRDCQFITRKAAMLNILSLAIPEGPELLAELSRDPELSPIALLMCRDDLDPAQTSADQAEMVMIGSFLELLELGGPEIVLKQLSAMPRTDRADLVRTVCDSGFPAQETLEEFRSLVAEPILQSPAHHNGHPQLRVVRNTAHRRPRRGGR
jgi:hypothetical protein